MTTAGKLGTDNIKEVLDVLLLVVKKAISRFSDGIQPVDFIEMIKWCLTDKELHDEFMLAINDAKMLLPEFLDLKLVEVLELFSYVKEKSIELNMDYTQFNLVIEQVPALNKFVKKIFY
jgi:hypothetical protein